MVLGGEVLGVVARGLQQSWTSHAEAAAEWLLLWRSVLLQEHQLRRTHTWKPLSLHLWQMMSLQRTIGHFWSMRFEEVFAFPFLQEAIQYINQV